MEMPKTGTFIGEANGIPRPQDQPWVLKDVDQFRESFGPVLQISLVPKLAVLESIEAPLQASLFPPIQDSCRCLPVEGHKLDTESTTCLGLVIFGCVVVFGE
jgi:hypothetical protein